MGGRVSGGGDHRVQAVPASQPGRAVAAGPGGRAAEEGMGDGGQAGDERGGFFQRVAG